MFVPLDDGATLHGGRQRRHEDLCCIYKQTMNILISDGLRYEDSRPNTSLDSTWLVYFTDNLQVSGYSGDSVHSAFGPVGSQAHGAA